MGFTRFAVSCVVRLPLLLLFLFTNFKVSKATQSIVSVSDYGAVGDGITDDSKSIQEAISAAFANDVTLSPPCSVFFPSGYYLVSETIFIPTGGSIAGFEFFGSGHSSNILWSFDDDLFIFNGTGGSTGVYIHDIALNSINDKTSSVIAFNFINGIAKSLFYNVLFRGDEIIPGINILTSYFPTCIDLGSISDTTTIENCIMWFIKGTGIRIGEGSEIRIIGGRIIGGAQNYTGFGIDNIGVHATGNNGGVHFAGTDIIALYEGIRLDQSKTGVSNREIFITHATLDSNFRGLSIYDNSYVSIAGCWAASSKADNIYLSQSASGSLVSISGGTIFNSGVGGVDNSTQGNGITAYAGSFTISGVEIRNNVGKGVWVASSTVKEYAITSSKIYSNGIGMDLSGGGGAYLVSGNIFSRNSQSSDFGSLEDGALVANNVNRD